MRSCLACACALVVSILMVGCGGGGSGGGSEATDTDQPLKGKELGKESQLVGSWVCIGDDYEFQVMEFMKDGKVIVGDAQGGMQVNYSVLEGGRLSLEAEGGMTQIFNVTLAGDQLEISAPGGGLLWGGTARYRKLKSGETPAQALAEIAQARQKAYQDRMAALETYLKQPGLVLAFGETAGAPASIALEIAMEGNSFSGRAWHDDRPPHLNQISGYSSGDSTSNTLQVSVSFGPRIAPAATQPDGGGQITMNVEGDGKDLKITSRVRFGDGPEHDMVLRPDAALHGQIVKRFDAENARIEGIKQPMIALLKDFTVLRGRTSPQDQRSLEPDTTELTLSRDPASGQYWVEGVFIGARQRGQQVTQAAAEIAVVNDQAILRVVCPPSREYQLRMSASGSGSSGLSGVWTPIGYNQGGNAQFEVVEALDAATRDAKFASQRQALKSLGGESMFAGLAHEDSASGMDMPIPCRVKVTVNADNTVSGTVEYPSLSTLLTATGQIAETRSGPRLQLTFTGAEYTPGDQIFFRSIQSGMWSLAPADGGGPMKLAGYFNASTLRTTTLTLVDDSSLANLRKRVAEAIGDGGRFLVAKYVGWQQMIGWPEHVVPTVAEWSLDNATGEVTGTLVANGRALGTNEQAVTSFDGRLAENDGWITLDLMQTMPWGRNIMVSAIRLYAFEDSSGGLHLSGGTFGFPNQPIDQPLPAFPEQFGRLVGFVPVSETDAQTRGAIDKAIAAVEQAKADAEAAKMAQETAALDAKRAKMEPFFGFFRTPAGAVITTNAPLEMGSVILDARVDEADATITGKGLDLREMPFREFTFECGLNNYGQLTVTTSPDNTAYAFAAPTDGRIAAGRYMALTLLSSDERAKIAALMELGQRLGSAAQSVLTVEVLDPAAAKERETGMLAHALPGVSLYRNANNPQVAAMFTPQSNGRYRWAKEPILHRLNEPVSGTALYIKNGGPTDNLDIVINGVHRANIAAIAQLGAAIVHLPADLQILDLRLEAVGMAQARGVVLLK